MAKTWLQRLQQAKKHHYTTAEDAKLAMDWMYCSLGERSKKVGMKGNEVFHDWGKDGERFDSLIFQLDELGANFGIAVAQACITECCPCILEDDRCVNCIDQVPTHEKEIQKVRDRLIRKAFSLHVRIGKVWDKYITMRKKLIKEGKFSSKTS